MRRNEEEQGIVLFQWGKSVFLGGVTAFLFCVLFLFLVSIGISNSLLKAEQGPQVTVVACVLGSFLGGLLAVGQHKGRKLLIGLAVGGILFLLLLTCGILMYDSFSLENGGIELLGGTLCGGGAAGILTGGGKRHKLSPPKKRRR